MPRILGRFLAACAAITVAGIAAAAPAAAATNSWRTAYTYRGAHGRVVSIAAVSPRDAWAAGVLSGAHGYLATPFVLHWNGAKWRRVTVPGSAGFLMTDVAASSAGNVWLFAGRKNGGSATVFRWDGAHWHRMRAPWDSAIVLSPRNAWSLTSVFCSSSGGKQQCGSDVRHWTGSRWQRQVIPGCITELTSTPGGVIWAVGTSATGRLVAYRRTRAHWTAVRLPHPRVATALGAVAASAKNVWIGVNSGGTADYALHWNGRAWQATRGVTAPLASRAGTGIVISDGHGGVWLGSWHWNGRTWANTWKTAPSGLSYRQIVKVPGTARSYWAAAARQASHSVYPVIGGYGPLP